MVILRFSKVISIGASQEDPKLIKSPSNLQQYCNMTRFTWRQIVKTAGPAGISTYRIHVAEERMGDRTCFNNSSRRVHVARLFCFHDVFVCQIECVTVCFAFSPDAIWIGVGLPRRSPFLPSIDADFREKWSSRTSTPMHCPSSLSFLFGGKCSFTFPGFYCLSFWIGGEETSEVIWFQVVRIGFVCAAKWPNLAGLIGRRGNAMWLVWGRSGSSSFTTGEFLIGAWPLHL